MIIKDCKFETILIDSRCLRKGITILLCNSDGKKIKTEASPLPGYSNETFEMVLDQLKQVKRKILSTFWTKEALHSLSTWDLYPSVYFAIETGIMDLFYPLEKAMNPPQKYGLLFGSPEEILAKAEEIFAEGYQHVKVKLGHFSPSTAHRIVKQLQDRFILRIDLNKKWSVNDTTDFCSYYPKDYFYYIEEPCTSAYDSLKFNYPFALDESLRSIKTLKPYLQSPNLKALILKPTLIYPFFQYLNLGPEIVLTSSFESPIGAAQIERLISRLDLTQTRHGLDTLRYFESYYALSDCKLEKTIS